MPIINRTMLNISRQIHKIPKHVSLELFCFSKMLRGRAGVYKPHWPAARWAGAPEPRNKLTQTRQDHTRKHQDHAHTIPPFQTVSNLFDIDNHQDNQEVCDKNYPRSWHRNLHSSNQAPQKDVDGSLSIGVIGSQVSWMPFIWSPLHPPGFALRELEIPHSMYIAVLTCLQK